MNCLSKIILVILKSFIEKPNLEVAKRLINDKRYVWNSGMFLFKSSAIINELEKFEPEIIIYCKDSIEKSSKDLDFLRVEENNFKKCPNIPIDIAVMEKTKSWDCSYFRCWME